MGKQLVSFIACGCELSAFFFVNYKDGRFSPGTPVSSTTKTGRHDITEILLKVALSTKNQIKSNQSICLQAHIAILRNFKQLVSFIACAAS
jgi:hypothetical protein